MKVVLDTNVVMSAIFFGGDPLAIVRAAISKKIELVASKQVITEYHEIAERLSDAYSGVTYKRALAILESHIKIVKPVTLPRQICRDPDDDAILACAMGAKAKIICSGDDDLLSLSGVQGIEILKPRAFRVKYL